MTCCLPLSISNSFTVPRIPFSTKKMCLSSGVQATTRCLVLVVSLRTWPLSIFNNLIPASGPLLCFDTARYFALHHTKSPDSWNRDIFGLSRFLTSESAASALSAMEVAQSRSTSKLFDDNLFFIPPSSVRHQRPAFQEQPHRAKTAPIDFTHPVPPQRAKMRARRISLVLVEAVLGKAQMQPAHFRVAFGLRKNRGRGDHPDLRVAIDDRAGGERKRRAMRAVEQHLVGQDRKRFHRPAHREQACLQDVEAVDLLDTRPGDRPGERPFLDEGGEPLALECAQQLGIGDAGRRPAPRLEHHGRGKDRSRERPAAGLVDAADQADCSHGKTASVARAAVSLRRSRRIWSRRPGSRRPTTGSLSELSVAWARFSGVASPWRISGTRNSPAMILGRPIHGRCPIPVMMR